MKKVAKCLIRREKMFPIGGCGKKTEFLKMKLHPASECAGGGGWNQ